MNATIHKLRRVVDIDSWHKTAPFPCDTMRSAPDTSFHEHGNAGSAPSYQWYTKIEVACENFRRAVVDWRKCNEELDWGFRNNLIETDQIARRNCMHREICGIDDLMHVADRIDLFSRHRHFWTVDKMRRAAPSAFSILGLIQDLQKLCQTNDWLIEDRAPFLAYKVHLLLRRHQLRGLRGTTQLGYKRYWCAPVRTQDVMVQLQEYYRLGKWTGRYTYNAVAPGAHIDLVQLSTIYQTGPGQLRYYNFDEEIQRVGRLHSTNEEYINLFSFQNTADLVQHLGTLKYLMSGFEGGY